MEHLCVERPHRSDSDVGDTPALRVRGGWRWLRHGARPGDSHEDHEPKLSDHRSAKPRCPFRKTHRVPPTGTEVQGEKRMQTFWKALFGCAIALACLATLPVRAALIQVTVDTSAFN